MEVGLIYLFLFFTVFYLFFECTYTGEKILDKIIEKYYKK